MFHFHAFSHLGCSWNIKELLDIGFPFTNPQGSPIRGTLPLGAVFDFTPAHGFAQPWGIEAKFNFAWGSFEHTQFIGDLLSINARDEIKLLLVLGAFSKNGGICRFGLRCSISPRFDFTSHFSLGLLPCMS
jgi:hypothetical protein